MQFGNNDMENERLEAREREVYEFRVRGELDAGWAEWFEGFQITACDGESILLGEVQDPAALYGIINKFRNLNLVLLSVNIVPPRIPDRSP